MSLHELIVVALWLLAAWVGIVVALSFALRVVA